MIFLFTCMVLLLFCPDIINERHASSMINNSHALENINEVSQEII